MRSDVESHLPRGTDDPSLLLSVPSRMVLGERCPKCLHLLRTVHGIFVGLDTKVGRHHGSCPKNARPDHAPHFNYVSVSESVLAAVGRIPDRKSPRLNSSQ